MPDKWEYPWYAAWDLAFHATALANVDLDFAKQQLDLLLQRFFLHPNGQIPAYEWNFSDVNPPVHAWAAIHLYRTEKALRGKGDADFLRRSFQKLSIGRCDALLIRVFIAQQTHPDCEGPGRIEPRINLVEFGEASDHQPRANEQHERQRDLADDKRAAEPISLNTRAGPAAFLERIGEDRSGGLQRRGETEQRAGRH